jgi:hypothetical protein
VLRHCQRALRRQKREQRAAQRRRIVDEGPVVSAQRGGPLSKTAERTPETTTSRVVNITV